MKKSFWLPVFISVFLPLAALTLAGWHFLHEHEVKEQKQYFKTNLKKESFYLSSKVDKLLSLISKELKGIADHKVFPEKSLFSAVALKNTEVSSNYMILLPQSSSPIEVEKGENSSPEIQKQTSSFSSKETEKKSSLTETQEEISSSSSKKEKSSSEISEKTSSLSSEEEKEEGGLNSETQNKASILSDEETENFSIEMRNFFQKLSTHLPENRTQKIWFQDISPSKEDKIIAFMLNLSSKKTDLKNKKAAVGFIRKEDFIKILSFLDFNDREANEALLSTSQGWLLFHTKKENLFNRIPTRSPLSKVLSKKRPQFAKWTFDKKRKGNYEKKHPHTSTLDGKQNLAYILPLKGTNLSIISKTSFNKPSFALTEWEWGWLALSLAAFIFMLSLLLLILSPFFSAYTQLKSALSQYGLKGELPFISSHNPFLRFYSNVWNASQNKKQETEKVPMKDSMKERLTFRNILDSAQERLKERFPGLSIQKDLQTNVSLWYFAPFMRKILSALLLNAIESMGGSQRQYITVKSWEEEGCFVFTVEDKGQGLTKDAADKAFNLYYSTKSQLGVGLNLAESLIIANKGSLELLPGENAGATALVRLPMSCFLKTQLFRSTPFRGKGLNNFKTKEETEFLVK